jgi:hypothetical protein
MTSTLDSNIPEVQQPLSANSLRQNLEAQLAAHEQVNGLLQQLRQSVMVGKTEAVKSVNHQLVQLGDTMARLETERQQLLSKAGYATMPLRQLMLSMPASEQQCLGQLREKLNQTIRQVRIEQEDTQSVLAQSIHWVNQTVSSISKALQPDPAKQNYGPPKPKRVASSDSMATSPPPTHLPLQSGSYSKLLASSHMVQPLGGSHETSIIERTA